MNEDDFDGSMNNDQAGFDSFLEAMGGVKPIVKTERVALTHKADNSPGAQHRRVAAAAELSVDGNALSGGGGYVDGIEQVSPNSVLQLRRNGVQDNVFRKLRQGKYTLEARLDLHHQTVEQARNLVFQFVLDCREHDLRCALITHGKGEGRELPARLKSCVAHWLPQMDEVLAFHSAEPQHGGTGATYILLRKSGKKAEEFY